jgi:putative PIN family toxin of toxin-antitoxin system
MIRAVLDTNIVVGAHISRHGAPSNVLDAFYARKFSWVISPSIIDEIEDVLLRPRVQYRTGLRYTEIVEFISLLKSTTEQVSESIQIYRIKDDPSDNKFLACAFEGLAKYIVSGDVHLLSIKHYHLVDHVVQTVTANQFLIKKFGYIFAIKRRVPP